MSVQILLQGKILGIGDFLPAPADGGAAASESLVAGRAHWVTLAGEILPRALLEEFGLARILLGSAGGGQFLLVLPEEFRGRADAFLTAAAAGVAELSGGRLRLIWASTENLGDWSNVRRRLTSALDRARGTPGDAGAFAPFDPVPPPDYNEYFSDLAARFRQAESAGWSASEPARILLDSGDRRWRITPNISADGIVLARHAAPAEDGLGRAAVAELASRAVGQPGWGVLRGEVDHVGVRIRRVAAIEEHVPLSVLYKQFFAGELEVLCSMPEFWRKVTVLYTGGADFAAYGSWDALIALAREIQRLFHRFAESNLADYPGPEGKTITMAVAIAREGDGVGEAYEEAGRNLAIARASDVDCLYVLGRVLEWKRLNDAAELKDVMLRMTATQKLASQALLDLRGIYGKALSAGPAGGAGSDKVWRFHRRLRSIFGPGRDKEFQRLRNHLAGEISGRKERRVKLRPSGLVAIEWARLLEGIAPVPQAPVEDDLPPAPVEGEEVMPPPSGVEFPVEA